MSEPTVPLGGVSPEMMEAQGRARLARADLSGAAGLLQHAARDWNHLGNDARAGACWLLAASALRLAGSMKEAGHAARCAEVLPLSDEVRRGVDMELAEQALASGDAAMARERFAFVLARYTDQLDASLRAVVLQRRAIAAAAAQDDRAAAVDYRAAAELMQANGQLADAETARLAAVSCLARVDITAAEILWRDIDRLPPRDGAGAARRGLVGGQLAEQSQQPALALARYGVARQGALDARDAGSYLVASVQSSILMEQQGQVADAYARLASAWVTLGELLGRDTAATMLRPAMKDLRDRLGLEEFQRVREAYAERRKKK